MLEDPIISDQLAMPTSINNNRIMTNIQLSNGSRIHGIKTSRLQQSNNQEIMAASAGPYPNMADPHLLPPLRYTPGLKCDSHLESLRPVRGAGHRPFEAPTDWKKKLVSTESKYEGSFIDADMQRFRPEPPSQMNETQRWIQNMRPPSTQQTSRDQTSMSANISNTVEQQGSYGMDELSQIKMRNRRFQNSCMKTGQGQDMGMSPPMQMMQPKNIAQQNGYVQQQMIPVVYMMNPATCQQMAMGSGGGPMDQSVVVAPAPSHQGNYEVQQQQTSPNMTGNVVDMDQELKILEQSLNALRKNNRALLTEVGDVTSQQNDMMLEKQMYEGGVNLPTFMSKAELLNKHTMNEGESKEIKRDKKLDDQFKAPFRTMKVADNIAIKSLLMNAKLEKEMKKDKAMVHSEPQ